MMKQIMESSDKYEVAFKTFFVNKPKIFPTFILKMM